MLATDAPSHSGAACPQRDFVRSAFVRPEAQHLHNPRVDVHDRNDARIAHTTSMRMDARGERQNFLTAPRRNGHGSSQADGTACFGLLHRVDTSKDVEPALDAAKATVNILASDS
jgi:hypothetical protein